MLFKPKKIVENLRSKWIRYKFSRPSCTICNNKYCYIPVLINSHTIVQLQEICLYSMSSEFIVYIHSLYTIHVDKITKDLQTR